MDINYLLHHYAAMYENKEFLIEDPSWFMHQVTGSSNQELFALIASSLSHGRRKQFFPKIQYILDCSKGDPYTWIMNGLYRHDIPDDESCYYRLFTNHTMFTFLKSIEDLLNEYGTLEHFVADNAMDGYSAIKAITTYFSQKGIETIIPKNASSACKRICMFLRWMVRDKSPVDLGLWSGIIDKRTLIMPLDTHVVQEACRLRLLDSKNASMIAAKKLSNKMLEFFPDDPLRGDFALFGYGISKIQ